uniref:Uncharacterized protein n=1 Tax=Oryza punctata TaxID=4537 RepID=A0A0E0KZL7_ORYPU
MPLHIAVANTLIESEQTYMPKIGGGNTPLDEGRRCSSKPLVKDALASPLALVGCHSGPGAHSPAGDYSGPGVHPPLPYRFPFPL